VFPRLLARLCLLSRSLVFLAQPFTPEREYTTRDRNNDAEYFYKPSGRARPAVLVAVVE
jgi:hypothetical protein